MNGSSDAFNCADGGCVSNNFYDKTLLESFSYNKSNRGKVGRQTIGTVREFFSERKVNT